MNIGLHAFCLMIAIVLFGLATFFHWLQPNENRFNLVAGGLFFYSLKEIFPE
jgi:hypothetical protein